MDGAEAYDGRADVELAAQELAERLPEPLVPLARVAYNYRWCWQPGGSEVFAAIDRERFELCLQNPVRLLSEASHRALKRAASEPALVRQARLLEEQLSADLARPAQSDLDPAHPVAFLCAEYGVHVSLPVYSGGLGALAGDILKEASDRALPMVAIGLMYRKGYFRQRIDASGWQHEYWVDTDPQRLPAARVTRADGSPLSITVPIYGSDVEAYIWRVDVGRVPLFLLDTDITRNSPTDRWITARLYEADAHIRLAQYVLLGVGGVAALRALGIDPGVIHLNEGHAALAPLALAETLSANNHVSEEAFQQARARTVFTTHTPVAAGNDSYPADQVRQAISRLPLPLDETLALGRTHLDNGDEPFGVTQAALRMSRAANGVSRRHGEVSRAMWAPLWQRAAEEAPIGHVTNGVHVPTWVGPTMRELFDEHLGADWSERVLDPSMWEAVRQIPDEVLWAARNAQRAETVEFLRRRSTHDRLLRGDTPQYVEAAAQGFREDVLTIGFARRVATYKRLELLTRDRHFIISLLSGERPVQVVLAGKAHPRDEEAKYSLQRLFALKSASEVAGRVIYLDDYDLATGAMLTQGCDVWLNVPRPPLEASGTSGMKAAVNGGLQLSVLDGWWAEGYDGSNGWAIEGEIADDPEAQDQRHAEALHRLLTEQVVPTFYDRDERGLPVRWLEMVRSSLITLIPQFSAARMLQDYVRGPYARV
ncbi:MAG TPA: alpha-glucan family phosphorylase [Solirubrobacteraceae bacterium]|nr:alpha-glucan family phosphorylase [Solirubrobacteraceae bacterium]